MSIKVHSWSGLSSIYLSCVFSGFRFFFLSHQQPLQSTYRWKVMWRHRAPLSLLPASLSSPFSSMYRLAIMGDNGDHIAHFLSVEVILVHEVGGVETEIQQGTYLVWVEICSSVTGLLWFWIFSYILNSLSSWLTVERWCDILGHHCLFCLWGFQWSSLVSDDSLHP